MERPKIFKARFRLECNSRLQGEDFKSDERALKSTNYESAVDEAASVAADLLKADTSFDSVSFCVFDENSTPPVESRIRFGGTPRDVPKYK